MTRIKPTARFTEAEQAAIGAFEGAIRAERNQIQKWRLVGAR